MDKTILEAYIRLGYPLLPLVHNGKAPLTPLVRHGLKEATTDRATVESWLTLAPDANWGLLAPEGVLVLDFDRPEAWDALRAEFPELERAPRQRTPRGGCHVFLRLPAWVNGQLSASTRKLDGVDLRGMGKAYVAVAPSVVDGRPYVWEVPLVEPAALPEIPPGLLQRLLPPPPAPVPSPAPTAGVDPHTLEAVRRKLREISEEIARTPEGRRHNTLLEAAHKVGGWLVHGLDPEEARQALVQAALQAGLPLEEARRTVEDGLKVGKTKPLPPPEGPHPLEGLAGGGEVLKGVPRYVVRHGMIQATRVEGRGGSGAVAYRALANFAAVIRREIRATDGLETETLFELEGYLADGRPLPKALVSASEFAGMGWVPRVWGGGAVVAPGQGNKDHLRAAIQFLSLGRYEQATVYRHLGWAKIGGRWHYLHAGGAIADGTPEPVEVEPGRTLEGFALPDPPEGDEERERILDLWELTEVAPHRVMVPLLLYALGAPLGPAPFSLYLAGPTGARKTSIALVLQSLFGHTAPHPPIGWEATANALEGAAFAAKDALLLVDDFAPTGPEKAQQELRAKAARLLRSQGNGTGRLRMRADGSVAGDKPPRGSLLITGEDLPPGHSVRARALFLELNRGEVDLKRLSEAQKLARRRVYAQAMAAWIRWLAKDLEAYQARLQELIEELRPRWDADHGRTTDALARLHAVWLLYKEYAAARGVDLEALEETVLEALEAVREAQRGYHRDVDPVQRFLSLLYTALRMGHAHLVPLEASPKDGPDAYLGNPALWGWRYRAASGTWEPQGPRIGWVPRDWETRGIYLDPAAAWLAINRLADERGEALPTERTLWKALAAAGVIRTVTEAGKVRYQVRLRVDGGRVRAVNVLPRYAPSGGGDGEDGPEGGGAPPRGGSEPRAKAATTPPPAPRPSPTAPATAQAQAQPEPPPPASRPQERRETPSRPVQAQAEPPSRPQEERKSSSPPTPQERPRSPWDALAAQTEAIAAQLRALRAPILEAAVDGYPLTTLSIREPYEAYVRELIERARRYIAWPQKAELFAVWPRLPEPHKERVGVARQEEAIEEGPVEGLELVDLPF